jgi:hypothetical protein
MSSGKQLGAGLGEPHERSGAVERRLAAPSHSLISAAVAHRALNERAKVSSEKKESGGKTSVENLRLGCTSLRSRIYEH